MAGGKDSPQESSVIPGETILQELQTEAQGVTVQSLPPDRYRH
ncbi:MAG: hypothetical protein WA939_20010 [Nodosilinea sp.]